MRNEGAFLLKYPKKYHWGTICGALCVAERISKRHEPFLQTGESRRG
jgi:hypothetical protein